MTGWALGVDVITTVGAKVGTPDGISEGAKVGTLVGIFDGNKVGWLDGAEVGILDVGV